jgi:hypothetical protein
MMPAKSQLRSQLRTSPVGSLVTSLADWPKIFFDAYTEIENSWLATLSFTCICPLNMNTISTKQQRTSIEAAKPALVKQGALKLKDACEYLGGISPSSVRRLINRGLLRPNRALRHVLISVTELDRFLAGGQQ